MIKPHYLLFAIKLSTFNFLQEAETIKMTIEEELKRDIISFARNEGCTAEEIKSLLATLQESIDKRDIRDFRY